MIRKAEISACGKYRYSLTRWWAEGPIVYWIMLNPSTADADVDDPTIRKCAAFSKQNGFGGMVVYNLFAWRATNPKKLLEVGYGTVVGSENNARIESIPLDATVVCAWGAFAYSKPLKVRPVAVLALLSKRRLVCVKATGDRPWHPLYVKYGPFMPLDARARAEKE